MTSSRNEPFEIARVPPLDLMSGPVTVDVGYLGGEAHRQAFAKLFGKSSRTTLSCSKTPSLPVSTHRARSMKSHFPLRRVSQLQILLVLHERSTIVGTMPCDSSSLVLAACFASASGSTTRSFGSNESSA